MDKLFVSFFLRSEGEAKVVCLQVVCLRMVAVPGAFWQESDGEKNKQIPGTEARLLRVRPRKQRRVRVGAGLPPQTLRMK